MTERRWKIKLERKAADCWIGVYWRSETVSVLTTPIPRKKLDVWVCVLPMLPLHISMRAPLGR